MYEGNTIEDVLVDGGVVRLIEDDAMTSAPADGKSRTLEAIKKLTYSLLDDSDTLEVINSEVLLRGIS